MGSNKSKDKKCGNDQKIIRNHFTICGCSIPYQVPCHHCEDQFHINLAGLTDNLNFQLLKMEGCELEIDTTVGTHTRTERGKIHNVGIDFIEIQNDNGQIVTLLKDKINHIRRAEDFDINLALNT